MGGDEDLYGIELLISMPFIRRMRMYIFELDLEYVCCGQRSTKDAQYPCHLLQVAALLAYIEVVLVAIRLVPEFVLLHGAQDEDG
jgi:hypothetical protein